MIEIKVTKIKNGWVVVIAIANPENPQQLKQAAFFASTFEEVCNFMAPAFSAKDSGLSVVE